MFRRHPHHELDQEMAASRYLIAASYVAAMIQTKQPAEDVYRYLISLISTVLAVDPKYVFIRIADPATGKTKHLCTFDNPYEDRILTDDLSGVVGRAMRTRKVQVVPNVRADPDFHAFTDDAQSEIAIPVLAGDECYGVVNVESPQMAWFTAADIIWAQLVAALVAQTEMSERMLSEEDRSEQVSELNAILDDIRTLIPPPATLSIMRRVPKSQDRLLISAILPAEVMPQYLRLRGGQGLTSEVITSGVPFVGDVGLLITHLIATHAAIVYPIANPRPLPTDSGLPIGVLNIESPVAGSMTPELVESLKSSGIIARIAQALVAPPSIEQRLDALIDTESSKLATVYPQILNLAVDIIGKPDLSGAIHLLRDRSENLAQVVDPASWQDDPRWIVVQAHYGAYRTDEPDRRLNRPSITRRIISSGQPEIIEDVSRDPDYWSAGPDLRSMLAVPILDQGQSIGTIELLSPRIHEFATADVERVQHVAAYVGQLVKRIEDVDAALRAETRLEYTARLRDLTAPLYEWKELTQDTIYRLRGEILQHILAWSLTETQSQVGAIFQAEAVEERQYPELVLRAQIGAPISNAPVRLRPQFAETPADTLLGYPGIMGHAFLSGQTQRIQEARASQFYVERFPGMERTIAAPIRRGYDIVGVFDVEATGIHQYTVADRAWIEFFADRASSALNTVEIALSNLRQVMLRDLMRLVNREIARLRARDRHEIRDNWHSLRQTLLDHVCDMTAVTKATIYVAVNAYDIYGALDLSAGQLVESTASPRQRLKGRERYFFKLQDNMAGAVFQTQEKRFFNRRAERPPEFHELPDQDYEVRSSAAVPIFDGARVVGVLQVDSKDSGVCTEENIATVEEAALMAGDIIVAARSRLDEIQVSYLRDFELDILSLHIPSLDDFMLLTLQAMRRLANVVDGWGQIVLLRRYRLDDGSTVMRIDQTFHATFGTERPETMEVTPLLTGVFDQDHPPVTFALFNEVIHTQRMRMVLDAWHLLPSERQHAPWPEARSLICVPLLQPTEGMSSAEKNLEVFGFLAVSSRRSARFSDNDSGILTRLARSVVIGYRNLGLANAQKDALEQMTHDVAKALIPMKHTLEDATGVLGELRQALTEPNMSEASRQLDVVSQAFTYLNVLQKLAIDLIFWSIDLTDQSLVITDEPVTAIPVSQIVDDMREPIAALARVLASASVYWSYPEQRWVNVQGSVTRERLIKAILFRFIENAIKYGQGTVHVAIAEVPGAVTFAVQNTSPVIPLGERERIFDLGFRGSNVNPDLPGSGAGLYQVKRIAAMLGGSVDYRAEGADRNTFLLELPAAVTATQRKGY